MIDPLMFIALLPAVVLVVYICRKDRPDKEPPALLVKLLGYGALSCLPAIVVELILSAVIERLNVRSVYLGYFLEAFVVAGLTEEMSRLCRRDMDLPEITHCRTVTMLTFGERPLFTAQFGAAAHAAAGQSVSGDALDQFCDTSGRAQMLLCDGMGTGRAAATG